MRRELGDFQTPPELVREVLACCRREAALDGGGSWTRAIEPTCGSGSFIAGLGRDAQAESIVRAVIALSRSLGLQVVAEGVEHRQQLDFLRTEGCDVAQGYFLGGPMRAESLLTILSAGPGAVPPTGGGRN